MVSKKKQDNSLTKKEQATVVAYKMLTDKVNKLEASLKKTQDEAEKIRSEKNELEKKDVLLEEKLKNHGFITFLEFLSTATFGFALSYIPEDIRMVFSIGTPAIIIYIVCIYLTKK